MGDIPLAEVSGLAIGRDREDRVTVAAIGDRAATTSRGRRSATTSWTSDWQTLSLGHAEG